ncbi:hypothetical protein XA68_10733 [Ophiocordyceps unilateralis]|uniref:Uncharacterized protein n=1 Tax=Ophiocordyceps unilateralis TaxID=268505 RepID=A0A2A9PQQ3_OPHUN|nr:hypothetical protein XA68_10733 [Ophiocordyceps unilateralis]
MGLDLLRTLLHSTPTLLITPRPAPHSLPPTPTLRLSRVFSMTGVLSALRQEQRSERTTTTTTIVVIIIIAHLPLLLSSLFAQRRSAAYGVVNRLRRLVRRRAREGALVLLLNSTSSSSSSSLSPSISHPSLGQSERRKTTTTTTMTTTTTTTMMGSRSVLVPELRVAYGSVFANLVDLHLLCFPASLAFGPSPSHLAHVPVVEVLLDRFGLTPPVRGRPSLSREQRWVLVGLGEGHLVRHGQSVGEPRAASSPPDERPIDGQADGQAERKRCG